jgi:predicted homoserine dehydrogenase-like protein
VDVVATAKIDLKANEVLDGLGFYMTYGQAEASDICAAEGLLPIGLAEGAKLKRDVSKDAVLRLADVELPDGRLCDRLRREQDAAFAADHRSVAGGEGR